MLDILASLSFKYHLKRTEQLNQHNWTQERWRQILDIWGLRATGHQFRIGRTSLLCLCHLDVCLNNLKFTISFYLLNKKRDDQDASLRLFCSSRTTGSNFREEKKLLTNSLSVKRVFNMVNIESWNLFSKNYVIISNLKVYNFNHITCYEYPEP